MKKQITAMLLSALLLTNATACDIIPDTPEQETESTPEETTTAAPLETEDPLSPMTINTSFSDYSDILTTYKQLIELKETYPNEYQQIYLDHYRSTENEVLSALYHALIHVSPDKAAYSIKDLDGNGMSELIILSSDYSLYSMFAMQNGVPKVLARFWNNASIALDSSGHIYESSYGKGDNWSYRDSRISDNGELIAFAFGCKDANIDDPDIEYFKITDAVYSAEDNRRLAGTYHVTNKEEIDELLLQYNPIFENAQEITQNSGIEVNYIKQK